MQSKCSSTHIQKGKTQLSLFCECDLANALSHTYENSWYKNNISKLDISVKAPHFVPGGIRNVVYTRQHNIMCSYILTGRGVVVPNKVVGGAVLLSGAMKCVLSGPLPQLGIKFLPFLFLPAQLPAVQT